MKKTSPVFENFKNILKIYSCGGEGKNPPTREIAQNSIPFGAIEGNSSLGKPGWVAPCPPPASQRGESGTHRYFFKLYALDTMFNLPLNTIKSDLEKAMKGHIIEKAELVGLYQRG